MRGDGASLARQVARRDSVGVARRGASATQWVSATRTGSAGGRDAELRCRPQRGSAHNILAIRYEISSRQASTCRVKSGGGVGSPRVPECEPGPASAFPHACRDAGVARPLVEPDETVVVDPQTAFGAHACMLSPPRPKGRRWGAVGVEYGRRQLEQNVQKVVTRSRADRIPMTGPVISTAEPIRCRGSAVASSPIGHPARPSLPWWRH